MLGLWTSKCRHIRITLGPFGVVDAYCRYIAANNFVQLFSNLVICSPSFTRDKFTRFAYSHVFLVLLLLQFGAITITCHIILTLNRHFFTDRAAILITIDFRDIAGCSGGKLVCVCPLSIPQ